ncbi:MAG: hypothetical protein Q8O72_01210 [Bacteroidales bacterium]|nr:hypothetical protein [Bacteroidales bacterium]
MKIKQSTLFIAISTLLLSYLGLRAFYVPFTFDESATFFHFVHTGDFWFFTSLPDANNHYINTLLTYISYSLFGSSKFALRLPNLLITVVYLYYLYRNSLFLKNNSIRWIFILSLMFSHYFIEFFAVSRGYGLSMAFLFGVLYYLMKSQSDFSMKYLFAISLFLLLAIFSNLSLLVLSIAIILYQVAWIIFKKNIPFKPALIRLAIIILFQGLPLAFAAYYMFYLQGRGSLYYGNTNGFWALTVQSLILMLTGTKMKVFSVAVIVFAVFIVSGTFFLVWKVKQKFLFSQHFIFPFLLFSTVIGLLLLTSIFGINNPEDRVAMYLIPLFIGCILWITDALVSNTHFKPLAIATIPLLFLPVHFVYSVNLQYVNGYKTEVIPERFYETVVNDQDNHREVPATIGGYRMRLFCWTYMNFRNGGTQNLIDYQDYPEFQSDYQIIDLDENPEWLQFYEVIDTENILKRKLLKRKRLHKYKLVDEVMINPTTGTNDEFYGLARWKADTLTEQNWLIAMNMKIQSPEVPFHARVVIQVDDKNGKNLLYKNIPLDWLQTKWDDNNGLFKHSLLTGNLPPESNVIKVYIWNINKGNFALKEGHVELLRAADPD